MSLSWNEFVATHAGMVLAAALRVLTATADADEVAQEVFLEIFQSGKFEGLHGQPALIRTMTTRRAIDRLRSRKMSLALDGNEVHRRESEPSEYAIANELDERLQFALAGLAKREAEVFCLFYYDGNSIAQIAQALGISANAVTKALCGARAQLSEALRLTESEEP